MIKFGYISLTFLNNSNYLSLPECNYHYRTFVHRNHKLEFDDDPIDQIVPFPFLF